MKTRLALFGLCLAACTLTGTSRASDHIDGPGAITDPSADIADVYAFSSPTKAGNLVLIMDVLPQAGPLAKFSNQVVYKFRLRPASDLTAPDRWVQCTFDAPLLGNQTATCLTSSGLRTTVPVNDTTGGANVAFRVFAGRRADPFFFDLAYCLELMKTGTAIKTGINTQILFDVMSIVVEVDAQSAFGTSLLAVAAETTRTGGGLRVGRVDRAATPEHHLFVLEDLTQKDAWNREDNFSIAAATLPGFRTLIDTNLKKMDMFDGVVNWPAAGGIHPLVPRFLTDALLVDASKPCTVDTDGFFEIERERMGGPAHKTCGGRTPNADVIDDALTFYVNGPTKLLPRTSDGVDRPAKPATNTFPYLAAPNLPL